MANQNNDHNCPFYSRSLHRLPLNADYPFVMLHSRGNQCGLILNAHSPCYLEIESQPVEWSKCKVIERLQVGMG
jgi:hypothetical protein